MAEFLIKRIDATHPDRRKDRRGCYKRGDVVAVYEDKTCVEPPSLSSKMLIVKAPGMSFEDAAKYMESVYDTDWSTVIQRRKYQLDFKGLSAAEESSLARDRQVETTSERVTASIKERIAETSRT